jgi:putative transcriptional regulator
MEELSDKLKHCRSRLGWSQEHLARNVGVSLNTVQRWEAGKTKPSHLAMDKLGEILKDVLEKGQIRLF